MDYSLYQLLWFFILYSLAGWCAGVAVSAVKKHRFINTGFLNLPLCMVYGAGAVVFSIFLPELKHNLFFLFLGGVILSAAVMFLTGFMLERIFHRKWWDFSKRRFQFEGYVNLSYALLWGFLAIGCIWFANPLILWVLSLIPQWVGRPVLLGVYVLLAIDFVTSSAAVLQMKIRVKRFAQLTQDMQSLTDFFGNAITGRIQKRMMKAYPSLEADKLLEAEKLQKEKKLLEQEGLRGTQAAGEKKRTEVFAAGCCFYKLTALFFIGAFLGDIVETIFCFATTGVIMSRSSVIYGPFSIVWGLGCAFLTALLYKYKDKSDRYLFISGTVLGGAYEYICSVFTELVFGTVFWDYSSIPFNLGGRINLLFCFFWGIAAVVWLKGIYPKLSKGIERLPKRFAVPGIWVLIVFMAVNMVISAAALARYSQRQTSAEMPASGITAVEAFLDEHYPDERIERVYPNAKIVD